MNDCYVRRTAYQLLPLLYQALAGFKVICRLFATGWPVTLKTNRWPVKGYIVL
jgi:hypothetical protein